MTHPYGETPTEATEKFSKDESFLKYNILHTSKISLYKITVFFLLVRIKRRERKRNTKGFRGKVPIQFA